MAIGQATDPALVGDALARARQRAMLVPDLLVDARRIANTVLAGWHGRRRRGIGENFWQFRPYVEGESQARIDWRRSARDDHTYIRDREWEAAHTVWLWADFSPSMLYQSKGATVSKQSRAIVLILAMAELLARGGERIGWPGLTEPFASHNGAERLAARIANAHENAVRPDLSMIGRHTDIVLAGDFLDPPEETIEWLQVLSSRGVRAHLVEIVDPAEESFPYNGRTEFVDPEDGVRLTLGRAETLHKDYRDLYLARRQILSEFCRRLGWSYRTHHTDRPASEALMHLHLAMADSSGVAL